MVKPFILCKNRCDKYKKCTYNPTDNTTIYDHGSGVPQNCLSYVERKIDLTGLKCGDCDFYNGFDGKDGQPLAKCKATDNWLDAFNNEPCKYWIQKPTKQNNTINARVMEQIDDKYKEYARELLTMGNPMRFIMDTYHRTHVGDDSICNVCMAAIATTMIKNSKGLHVKPSGGSGKGKSDAIKAILHLVHAEKKKIGSMSGKSMFYDTIHKGTLFFSDDVKLNEDVVTTIKQTTTFYQQVYKHHTVTKNLESIVLEIPERICWILTSVGGFDDDQMGNRFVGLDVNESDQQDEDVFKKQVEMELKGISENTVDDDVLTCRALFQILDQDEYYVQIPFIESIVWHNKDNRRNFPMFLDILKSVTVYNRFQRESHKGAVLATTDDYNVAVGIYGGLAESNATNLTERELKLLKWLSHPTIAQKDISEIQTYLDVSNSTAKNIIHGRDKNGGLLIKIPGLHYSKESISTETGTTQKNFYWYDGPASLTSFESVVSLDESP